MAEIKEEKTTTKKPSQIVWGIVQWLLLGIGLCFIVLVFVFASNVPGDGKSGSLFGFETRLVVSGSMDADDSYYDGKDYSVKRIQVGSLVFIKDAPLDGSKEELREFYDDIELYDVLTFYSPSSNEGDGNIVTHRVIDFKEDTSNGGRIFICHGDAVEEGQLQYVYEGNIVGKVIGSSKFLGDLYRNVLSNKTIVLIAILTPSCIIIAFEARKIVKAVSEEVKAKKQTVISQQSQTISDQEEKMAELERKIRELENMTKKNDNNNKNEGGEN